MSIALISAVVVGVVLTVTTLAVLLYLTPQLYRWLQVRRWRRCRNAMALTYDDGPDPVTTTTLLDLLDELGAKATFYVVGFRAEAYPEVVREISRRGHELGAHSYSHRHAWKVWPWFDYRDAERGYQTLRAIAGVSGPYRPPFGKIALSTLIAMRARGRRVDWWSAVTNDHEDTFPDANALAAELAARHDPVVLMHSHHAEAHRREFMLEATRALVLQARQRGMTVVTMSELDSMARA
jgi:peptidoglycan/xylan/chitin deacetylase (PgdA/CDA1 family)